MKKYLIQVTTAENEKKIRYLEIPTAVIDITKKNQFAIDGKSPQQLEYEYVSWHYQTFINHTDSVGPIEWAIIPLELIEQKEN